MTMLLILGAGIAAFAIFIAGCFVGHRTGRNEGSDSANRWEANYAKNRGPLHPSKPASKDAMNKMAAAHMERVMTKEGRDL